MAANILVAYSAMYKFCLVSWASELRGWAVMHQSHTVYSVHQVNQVSDDIMYDYTMAIIRVVIKINDSYFYLQEAVV